MLNRPKIGRPDISESMQTTASGMMNKFDPFKMAKNLSGDSMNMPNFFGENSKSDKSKMSGIDVSTKVGTVDTGFYTTIASGSFQKLKVGDGAATIAAKQFNLINRIQEKEKVKREIKEDLKQGEKEKEEFKTPKKSKKNIIKNILKSETATIAKDTMIGAGIATIGAGIVALDTPKTSPVPSEEKKNEKQTASKQKNTPQVSTEGIGKLLESGESSNYEQLVIGKGGDLSGKFNKKPLTEMTISEVRELQKKMISSGKFPSSALGKYQIIGDTLQEAVNQGIVKPDDKFNKETQDKLFKTYLIGSKRKAISEYVSGKSDNIQEAQMELAKEFASVGVPVKVRKGEFGKYPIRDLEIGESLYSGVAGNKARITPEQSAAALTYDRIAQQNSTSNTSAVASNTDKQDFSKSTMSETNQVSQAKRIETAISENKNAKMNKKTVAVNNPVTNVMGSPAKTKILTSGMLYDPPVVPSFVTMTNMNQSFILSQRG